MTLPAVLAGLAREPSSTAILLDIDGTLAPIVSDPKDSRVPDETRVELRRLAGRYALVGCLTGRTQEQAREIVGVDELEYIGEHGLELRPDAGEWSTVLAGYASESSLPVERKRFTVAFHYRNAPDEEAAVAELTELAKRAASDGLVPKWGRKVLELRPPIDAHKGTAVVHMLTLRGITRALFAGDDLTDLDGFRAMDDLEHGVKIAVSSAEGPSDLAAQADIVVDGPPALLELLREL